VRSVKYDRLGVNDALRQFERTWIRLLPEPERMLPCSIRSAAIHISVEIARTRAGRSPNAFGLPASTDLRHSFTVFGKSLLSSFERSEELSGFEIKRKRDSSARGAPRNDKF